MKILQSEKGLAMPLVLVTLIVITLLSTALWHYGTSELRQAVFAEEKTRAYYIARSGAESLARFIRSNPEYIEKILAGEDINITEESFVFESDYLGKAGDLKVSLEKKDEITYIVTGIGEANGITETASIVIESRLYDGDDDVIVLGDHPLNMAHDQKLFANILSKVEPDQLPKDFIKIGDGIYSDGDYTVTFGEKHFFFDEDYFEKVVAPLDTTNMGSIFNSDVIISAEDRVSYENIRITNNQSIFTINTTAGIDTVLVVDNLDISTTLEVKGTGTAYLYVTDAAEFKNPQAMTQVDSTASFYLYLEKDTYLRLQANSNFTGFVYGPEATVEIQSNQTSFTGAMIVGKLTSGGGNPTPGTITAMDAFSDFFDKPIVNLLYWTP